MELNRITLDFLSLIIKEMFCIKLSKFNCFSSPRINFLNLIVYFIYNRDIFFDIILKRFKYIKLLFIIIWICLFQLIFIQNFSFFQ